MYFMSSLFLSLCKYNKSIGRIVHLFFLFSLIKHYLCL
ncbi:hypothetical protein M083_4118 [Bacteroides fragilis str. 3986 T(B)9]|uniref:Uncharacterized protein n=3 Tax=Bacteroides fragilis TaxID=817 RepID=A0A015TVI6_BACFG|nr:hypothetical protein M080_7695 [Bacteroides fragilis str. 3397 T10]EXY38865.1 hypothetical protein M117_4142 [Bacteroides fragilis str. 3774 T13]EXY44593.1 hypothetical protein M118_3930 [Bacteroides fragilis str. 3783N1-2]EXY49333.1 hypothetical protein M121_3904 [Bacteroides fragilis str. 3783N2-1]EXY54103.1 hypothetical protein M122_3877 [Bacteroides fragilis str. 3976T7]EXY58651.1 hypothetical protein M111_3845 [Bacteroides fragilis str. 3986T(B)10]EXY68218.1 hypothetical protein M083_